MISQSELFEQIYQIGSGWLGWSDEQVLWTPMPRILLAYEGRLDMIKAIFGGTDEDPDGSGDDDAEPTPEKSMTPEFFKALFVSGQGRQ